MKKTFLTLSFLCVALFSWAQISNLEQFNKERLQKQKVSMLVLGSWAVGNIALGLGLYSRHEGEERYFHLMNAGWNAVNLGLATAGYLSAIKADPAGFDLFQSINEQHKLQKIFLFNAGLDVGYILGGLYLRERGKVAEKNPERLKGFGKSIILQGSFLFAFDLAAYFLQASGNKDIGPLLSKLHFNGQQIGLLVRF
jgi:hypothetical protein